MTPPPSKLRAPARRRRRPRILVCTPEITELPEGMGNAANYIRAKGGGLGDISAGLIRYLYEDGRFDVHVVLPKYDDKIRDLAAITAREMDLLAPLLQRKGVHLVVDSAFSHLSDVYEESRAHPRVSRAEALQRYVINQLLDEVQPDVVHCNDWMTGLIPAAARAKGIRSVFTLHNVFTEFATPEHVDASGIDVRRFLQHLYFSWFPHDPEDTWKRNRIDFTATGVHAADIVNTVSPTFLDEMVRDTLHDTVPEGVRYALCVKHAAGKALGILNAPSDTVDPRRGDYGVSFDGSNFMEQKALLKRGLQERLGLEVRSDVPLFFWPSRLYAQKNPKLFLTLAPRLAASHGFQFVVVANGDLEVERALARASAANRGSIAWRPFDEVLSHIARAASDFVLMPSQYEPCGLPQMEGPRFGTLPVARLTGGLKDSVDELDWERGVGNGFTFEEPSVKAFEHAVLRAHRFLRQPPELVEREIRRVMQESVQRFSLANTASAYIEVYEQLIAERAVIIDKS